MSYDKNISILHVHALRMYKKIKNELSAAHGSSADKGNSKIEQVCLWNSFFKGKNGEERKIMRWASERNNIPSREH